MCIKTDLENGNIDSILSTIKKNNADIEKSRLSISKEMKNASDRMDENAGLFEGLSKTLAKAKL